MAGDIIRFGDEGHVCFLGQLDATVEAKGEGGEVTLAFAFHGPVLDQAIAERGDMPLPPYIAARRAPDERDRADYQTMFAQTDGSVAAPTAGLHFTDALVRQLGEHGIALHKVTLHVGAGTFLPVKSEDTAGHRMHAEWGSVTAATADALNAVRPPGGRIVAVGSTALRTLESASSRGWRSPAILRRHRVVHHAGLPVSLRRRDADQFSPAAIDAVHAGVGVVRPRCDAARLCARDRCRLPVLFLWRCLLAVSRSVPDTTARMSNAFSFQLLATDGAARRGEIATPHGVVATPAFMPVGTQATVKGLLPETVRASGADILLGNTYHLMLRPGAERVAALGGLHRFMNWPHAILTDSGGFQVMSLSQLRKIDEQGVTFRSHLDGTSYELSPERAIEIQALLGADIAMQLDECLKLPAPRNEIERAMTLSLRWAERSRARV